MTENVDQTTEQIEEKVYTQSEVNEMMSKRLARNTAKIRKEYERKYGELEEVLKAGTGKEDVAEVTDTFRQFYEGKGIQMPKKAQYSDKDVEVLAQADAREFVDYEDIKDELDRLTEVGASNMSAREKALFRILVEQEKNARESSELAKIGVTEEVYGSKAFKEFASQFNPNTPVTKIYEIYQQTQPKKNIQTMGSMKSNTTKDTGVKEFYTPEEARQFTKKDFDNNPELFKAVERSMYKWKR
jgi:hypothetical protein